MYCHDNSACITYNSTYDIVFLSMLIKKYINKDMNMSSNEECLYSMIQYSTTLRYGCITFNNIYDIHTHKYLGKDYNDNDDDNNNNNNNNIIKVI